MAYIIKDNRVIASVDTELKNGTVVKFAYNKCTESIDARRDFNLVNSLVGKVSRAKRWERECFMQSGVLVNDKEFLIY